MADILKKLFTEQNTNAFLRLINENCSDRDMRRFLDSGDFVGPGEALMSQEGPGTDPRHTTGSSAAKDPDEISEVMMDGGVVDDGYSAVVWEMEEAMGTPMFRDNSLAGKTVAKVSREWTLYRYVQHTRRSTRGGGRLIHYYPEMPYTNLHEEAAALSLGRPPSEGVRRDISQRLLQMAQADGVFRYVPDDKWHKFSPSKPLLNRIVLDAVSTMYGHDLHIIDREHRRANWAERAEDSLVAEGRVPGYWSRRSLKFKLWWRNKLGLSLPPLDK